MSWHGRLDLHYQRDGERTVAHDRHDGPLRVLQRLYPEGPGVCHHVLVHPPGGIVGGDRLEIDARLDRGTHALLTTPGATRFYRSSGDAAVQSARLELAENARLEWLPLEAIAYPGCMAQNSVRLQLAPGAETIGWDLLALGLPASGDAFDRGSFVQQIEWPGVWLERGRIDAADRLLLDSPLGLAGRRVLATMWFAAGTALSAARRDALLEAARAAPAACHAAADEAGAAGQAGNARAAAAALASGATAPDDRLVLLRVLGPRVEPVMGLLAATWARWRGVAWRLDAPAPRVWKT